MKNSRRRYTVIFHRCDDGWAAYFPAFPNLVVWFPDLERTRREAAAALRFHIACLRRRREPIPREPVAEARIESLAV